MNISEKLRKKYGSLKRFCEEMGISYGGFRTAISLGFLPKRYKEAVLRSGVVENENELYEMLYEDTQAKRLAKIVKEVQ